MSTREGTSSKQKRRELVSRLVVLLVKELRDLVRDRKVIYIAVLLPALLFPLLIGVTGKMLGSGNEGSAEISIRIGVYGPDLQVDRIAFRVPQATWARGGSKERIREGELDAVVQVASVEGGPSRYTILYDTGRELSRYAAATLVTALEEVVTEERSTILLEASGGNTQLPMRRLQIEDLAAMGGANEDTPRFLPAILILVLISAAAFAAIDLFPGERERGTLETLLVQPIRPREVLGAKYAAILVIGNVAVVANLLGMLLSSSLGSSQQLSLASVAALLVVAIPLTLFVAAVLVRVVARATSVREAQHYLLPLTLLCLVPAFLAASPDLPFDSLTACVPIAGPALAFREIALGKLPVLPILCMLGSTILASAFVLRGALKHLCHEENLLANCARQKIGVGSPALLPLFSILTTYVVSPFFLGFSPWISIGMPLLLSVGVLLVAFAPMLGMKLGRLFAPQRVSGRRLLLATATGFGLALLMPSIQQLQEHVLPMPDDMRNASSSLFAQPVNIVSMLFLFAALPALLEELLYRRFLLSKLLEVTDTTKAVILTAALFALHHLSIYRMLPTFVAGAVLCVLVLRTHVFWLAPIAHFISNSTVLLGGYEHSPLHGSLLTQLLEDPQLLWARIAAAAVLLTLPGFILDRSETFRPSGRRGLDARKIDWPGGFGGAREL